MPRVVAAPPRRVETLAYIIERIQRSGTSPSYGEIGRALRPPVDASRAAKLVGQLVKLGVIDRPIASWRGIRIHDFERCRAMIHEALGQHGWRQVTAMGGPEQLTTYEDLPILPLIELRPDLH